MSWLNHVTDWERVSLWRRIPCAFGRVILLVLLIAVVLKVFWPPIMIIVTDKWAARHYPETRIIPRPLGDYSLSTAPGTTVSYFGYRFDVPWRGKVETKAFPQSRIVGLKFESGRSTVFIVPTDQRGLLSQSPARTQTLQALFGDLVHRSAYDQYSAVMNASPSNITLVWPWAAAVRDMELLLFKGIFSANLKEGFFSFQLEGNRGFQIGDPGKTRHVELDIFTPGDHHVKIICEAGRNGPPLTQPELNRIIASFREVLPLSQTGSANGSTLISSHHPGNTRSHEIAAGTR